MKRRKFIGKNNAVSGVIEALLLVALVSIILATIQLVYIPNIMEEKEIDHMNEVENQFSYLKSTLDIQSITEKDVLVSSVITLGSKELPFFVTARATGSLYLIDETDTNSKIIINLTASDENIPLTSIKYVSNNWYCCDKIYQNYILEGGGIIAEEPDETMKVIPAITKETRAGKIYINYSLPVLKGTQGKKSYGGYKNCFIYTNYSHKNSTISEELDKSFFEYIDIVSDYLDAWNQSLNKFFSYEVENNYIKIEKYPQSSPEFVRIKPESKNIQINIIPIYIHVQIGPGIIKT